MCTLCINDSWQRVEIVKVMNKNEVRVFCVDNGRSFTVNYHALRIIPHCYTIYKKQVRWFFSDMVARRDAASSSFSFDLGYKNVTAECHTVRTWWKLETKVGLSRIVRYVFWSGIRHCESSKRNRGRILRLYVCRQYRCHLAIKSRSRQLFTVNIHVEKNIWYRRNLCPSYSS